MNVHWVTLCQNCSNCSAPMYKMAARVKNRKTFKRLLFTPSIDFEIISQECSLGDSLPKFKLFSKMAASQPRRLSSMHCPTGDQEVEASTPAEVGNIISWRLIVKYFLRSFSPFC